MLLIKLETTRILPNSARNDPKPPESILIETYCHIIVWFRVKVNLHFMLSASSFLYPPKTANITIKISKN